MPMKALSKLLRLSPHAQCYQYLLLTGPLFCAWSPSGSLPITAGSHSLLFPCCSLHVFAKDPSDAISSCIRPQLIQQTYVPGAGGLVD